MPQLPSRAPRAGSPLIRWLGWVAVVALGAFALGAPASVFSSADTGNNGTVKIHDGATETEPIVHNEPHVCTFHLHFFFADPFQSGTWWIEAWSPGDKGQVVLSGTYDTNSSGEDRQPEQGAYQLPDGHYKLFWQGDTDKHEKMKVFWVDCASASASPEASFEGSVAGVSAPPSEEVSALPSAEVSAPPSEEVSALPSAEVSAPPSEEVSAPPSGAVSEQPGSPGASFGGGVGGETNVPGGSTTGGGVGNVNGGSHLPTLPNTATAQPAGTPSNDGVWRMGLLAAAALLAGLLTLPDRRRRPI